MSEQHQGRGFLHLRALLMALVGLLLAFPASFALFALFVRPHLRELLAMPFPEKNQGMLLQRLAFDYNDVLPVYGSSELITEMANRADEFFLRKPTGFQICPVGAAGNHTLLSAEKIAALGKSVQGKKVAVILSPSWFRGRPMHRDHVAGNFSPLQAISLLQNSALDEGLRGRFVQRMLDYPTALEGHPLIESWLRLLPKPGWWSSIKRGLLRPALGGYRILLSWEDHLSTLNAAYDYDVHDRGWWHHKPAKVKWNRLIRRLEDAEDRQMEESYKTNALLENGAQDRKYVSAMSSAEEWNDFALLLDTLKQLKADALVISVPLAGVVADRSGISRTAREYYYQRVESMSRERGFAVNTFSDHDLDPEFIVGGSTHLAAKGWLFVNKSMNDFFHDRPVGPP